MLTYDPGDSFAHHLDPRTKLLAQAGFAVAAFAYTTPRGLLVLTAVALVALASARLSPIRIAWSYRAFLPFLALAPAIAAIQLGPPWIVPRAAVEPTLAGYRVLLVLLVGSVYVKTTPVRETRAAIQWLLPGKVGRFLGMGVSFVARFLPVLLSDLRRIREAIGARLGSERPLVERMQLIAVGGLVRAFERSDRLAVALQARCFSWNPTLPPLRFTRRDAPVLVVALALWISPLLYVV